MNERGKEKLPNEKSLSKGGIYYLIYNVLNIAFPFITGIYVARKLLPENIGAVAAAQNVAEYFVILAFLGIPTYGLREIAKVRNDPEERNKVFSELFIINFISTVVFLIAYVIVILSVGKYRRELPIYIIAGLSVALNAFNISWLYEGMEEFKFASVRNLFFKALCFVVLVVFVKGPKDYLRYAGITVFGTAGNYLINMAYAPKFVRFTTQGLNLKRHMRSIFFLVAVNLAIELYALMDVTMMNFMCGKENIAYYKYGNSIQKILLQVVNTFTMVLVPRITFFFKENRKEEFNALVSKGLILIVMLSVPMIVGIFFTSSFLIQELYGVQYQHSATILKMLSVLLLISPIGYLLGSRMLLVTDHENRMIICVGIGAVINLMGNSLLIPRYQEFGAAIASIISEIAVMVVYVQFGKKYYQLIGVGRSAVKVVLAVTVMAGYLLLCAQLPLSPWTVLALQVIGAIAVYFGMLLLLKEEITLYYYRQVIGTVKQRLA